MLGLSMFQERLLKYFLIAEDLFASKFLCGISMVLF